MFCPNNVFIPYRENFHLQKNDIATGENNLISISNIAMHHIIKAFANILTKANILKRFIDNIIWILNEKCITQKIEVNLILAF